MARIAGVSSNKAGLWVKLAYFFTRRGMLAMTGRAPARGLEPLEVYAVLPGLLKAYGGFEQASAKLHRLPERLRNLAELKAATMTSCEYCIDLGSQILRRSGFSDDELLALAAYRESPLFSDLEKLVLDFAVAMSRTPAVVPAELFSALHAQLNDEQMLELTHVVALENMRGRFNLAMGIGAAGFSEGMVCALPASAGAAA